MLFAELVVRALRERDRDPQLQVPPRIVEAAVLRIDAVEDAVAGVRFERRPVLERPGQFSFGDAHEQCERTRVVRFNDGEHRRTRGRIDRAHVVASVVIPTPERDAPGRRALPMRMLRSTGWSGGPTLIRRTCWWSD